MVLWIIQNSHGNYNPYFLKIEIKNKKSAQMFQIAGLSGSFMQHRHFFLSFPIQCSLWISVSVLMVHDRECHFYLLQIRCILLYITSASRTRVVLSIRNLRSNASSVPLIVFRAGRLRPWWPDRSWVDSWRTSCRGAGCHLS